ncbi:FecR domain-containing protein [Janthinobacterium sp. BJB401]|uniref:FecR domain-containing protein n=1 Tax=Janthinobacterium sp. BJB401 TaxID=2745934 RepID=UPI001594FC00|nr:FecR domain-containing protein [Janthinobacterium sp. BJB401]NVI80221.1 FecR domain-containing protein [Janthinobacterium sp. BJB401]
MATSLGARVPIDPRVLEQAADWLMQLHSGAASAQQRRECERWRASDPEHARAWQRAEALLGKLGGLPPELAMPALDRSRASRTLARRAALLKLAALLAVVPGAWLLMEQQGWRHDYQTATGERRDIVLADGSRISLNTATTLDVQFDGAQRLLTLRRGEIAVHTARDAQRRPFFVATAEGRLEALGTVFSVRQEDGQTALAVRESRVRVLARSGAQHIIPAGRQVAFTAAAIGEPAALDAGALAWRRGMLLADAMRLHDFALELGRYRPGIVRCDPRVANVRVSGAFPITDTDAALVMLVSTYPVAARTRLGGYWVTLDAPE